MATAHLIVSALLHREGHILLVQERGPGDPQPIWMLPGGRVEHGESVLEALRRELREETGLELAGEAPLAFVAHVIGSDEQYMALTFRCEAVGSLSPDDPDGYILDVAWVKQSEALRRIEGVDWYDIGPLRRHLEHIERVADVAVVDRR
jgi:8-oxo-dGTP diphosphatase